MVAKVKPSLEAFAQSATPTPAEPEAVKANVVELVPPAPQTAKASRKDRPHTTLYLPKRVQKELKQIALQYDRKVHDLYIEGIDLVLKSYGRPSISELAEK
jgi:hypothetical protein